MMRFELEVQEARSYSWMNPPRMSRSIGMIRASQAAGMKREEAIRILEELQRLQRSDRRHAELVGRLRALLDGNDRV